MEYRVTSIHKITDLLPSCRMGMSRSAFCRQRGKEIPGLAILLCSLWVTTLDLYGYSGDFAALSSHLSHGLASATELSRPCLFTLLPLGHNARFLRRVFAISCITSGLVMRPRRRNKRILSTHLICSTIAMESTATPVLSADKATCVGT